MTSRLPRDANKNPIGILQYVGDGQEVNATVGSNAVNATAFDQGTRAITITPDVDIYIRQGASASVTAVGSKHKLKADFPYDIAIGDPSTQDFMPYVAIVAVNTAGKVFISERA
ncbi:MAG: hypothetical protein DI551_08225 [Micavibrio aeruginosavorus]|uniref:Uncharacterized protein n=1 Tax=Micavibrio aeruginosavorus TaxID=349221 RepID=A0A2W5MWH8_9BACT|nr:MAG: hypothetical protein DI551_08225 [Micavibrio aeruginosavorus]